MPTKEFDLPSTDADEEDVDPPIFKLNYKRRVRPANGRGKGKMVAETQSFECLPYQPADAMRFLAGRDESSLAATAYIERCLIDDENAVRFLFLIRDRSIMLRGEELGDVLEWLTATYADRPTGRPSPSDDGPTPTGATSTGDSASEEQT